MIVETELLNDVQRAAVEHTDGPCLIFAGAGSGKTRVLTHRIAYLLNKKKVFPDRILAVTFTNKAAGEMKSRLEAMVGAPARDLWVGTFHAMCVRMLRRDGKKIGIASNFAIMDDTDQRQIIRDILHDLDMDERQVMPGAALGEISKAKNNLWSPDEYEEKHPSFIGERYAAVYREYERRLQESNGLDFDDLISRTIELLQKDEETRVRYQSKFRYVLVDEYQDVNYAQYKLVALLADEHKNITVVGDDDQSIYSWRGSDYRMILRFEEDFPGAKVFKLEENYRSTQTILTAANELVSNNPNRVGEDALHQAFGRREDHRLPGRVRAGRSPLRDGEDQGARPRRLGLSRLPRALSHERAVALLRRRLPRRGHSVSGRRRRRLLRAHRDQGHALVPALHREPVGRGRVPPHRQRAAPFDRPADADVAARCRERLGRLGRPSRVRFGACSSAPCRRSSANSSASPS